MTAGGLFDPMSICNPDNGPDMELYTLLRRLASVTRGLRTASIVLDRDTTPRTMMTSVMSSWAIPRRRS